MTRRSLLLFPFAVLAGRPLQPAHVRDLRAVIAAYEALLQGQMRAYQAAVRGIAGVPAIVALPPPRLLSVHDHKDA